MPSWGPDKLISISMYGYGYRYDTAGSTVPYIDVLFQSIFAAIFLI